ALRFWAFLMVFCSHIFVLKNQSLSSSPLLLFISNHSKPGFLGLDFFFVLSGFLISWIILEEQSIYNIFNWKNFFFRRTLRIWPLYFLIVFIGFGVAVYFSKQINSIPPFLTFATFTLNFYILKHGENFLFFLVFLWSIAVEEQFYIFWSLMLKFFQKHILKICFSIIFLSLIFRYFYIDDSPMLYFHTFSVMADFAIGSLFAVCAFRKNFLFVFLSKISRKYFLFIYFLLLLNFFFYERFYSFTFTIIFEKIIFSTLFALVIFDQAFRKNDISRNKFSKALSYLGKISFGLYCYHGIVITIFSKLAEKLNVGNTSIDLFVIKPIVVFIVTVIISAISYQYFEKIFLRLKNKFYPQQTIL
ncbi:MAG TPA: acyltransferase, partial [Bacteroidia bacterium]|nr:acyltransferase [Bacteroidia bacterium]